MNKFRIIYEYIGDVEGRREGLKRGGSREED